MERQKIIPDHQFRFRHKHATINTEQIHRIVKKISIDIDTGRYCWKAAFFDVSQVFDKVWHADLLHKIKSCFLPDLYAIIKSYLLQRTFRVKYGEMVTQLKDRIILEYHKAECWDLCFICYIPQNFQLLWISQSQLMRTTQLS